MRYSFELRPASVRSLPALFFAAASLVMPAAHAQNVLGGQGTAFKDTAQLKLPAGQRAAILEYEDLECPACAHAAPIIHTAIEKYKIPYLRHDFPLNMHIWSRDAAIIARYLQDKVNPELAQQYRLDIFANQPNIASKDDLQAYTRSWFGKHGQQMPFVVDPSGRFAAEVQADQTLGERLGVSSTPTIVVLAPHGWTQVVNVAQLYTAIDDALAQTPVKSAAVKPASMARGGPKKPVSAIKN
jgi:protein-disulfide isomerase